MLHPKALMVADSATAQPGPKLAAAHSTIPVLGFPTSIQSSSFVFLKFAILPLEPSIHIKC